MIMKMQFIYMKEDMMYLIYQVVFIMMYAYQHILMNQILA